MLNLAILFALAVIQNAAFTWVSRSRNSGDVAYHALAAIASNGIWFVMMVVIWQRLWADLTSGNWAALAATGLVYVGGTVIGSCSMMHILLKTEKGKRRVGAKA